MLDQLRRSLLRYVQVCRSCTLAIMTSGIRIRGSALPSQGTSALSNQPPSPGPAARAEGKRSLVRDMSWAAFGLVIGVLAAKAADTCARAGVPSHEPPPVAQVPAPADSDKPKSSWWRAFLAWIGKQNEPIPEKARTPMIVVLLLVCMAALVFTGVRWYSNGWNWGLLLFSVQAAFLTAAAGPLLSAQWSALITLISVVATAIGCWLSPPWDTTPKVIEPIFVIGGYEVTSGGKCMLEWSQDDKTSRYACDLSVKPVPPSPPAAPSATPAK